MNSLTLKSTVVLAGAALFCFGFLPAARAEGSVTFTGGYTTTFSTSDGDFGGGSYHANVNGAHYGSRIISEDYRDEIITNETWNANDDQPTRVNFLGRSTAAQSYLGSLTDMWILTPGPHPGFGWEPHKMFIRGLNVSEGGAPLLYILLAGLSIFGALFIGRRRKQPAQ